MHPRLSTTHLCICWQPIIRHNARQLDHAGLGRCDISLELGNEGRLVGAGGHRTKELDVPHIGLVPPASMDNAQATRKHVCSRRQISDGPSHSFLSNSHHGM
jgi:hypothetical protein